MTITAPAPPETENPSDLVRPKRVLVIGGGPTGLVALRNMLERGAFDEVYLVERRDDVGGVWYFDEPDDNNLDSPNGDRDGATTKPPRWPSPAYPNLIGNVLPTFLSYSLFPFPASTRAQQPFPTLAETHGYLKDFAVPLIARGVVRLNIEVLAVEELPEGAGWCVRMRDWSVSKDGRGREFEERWDAVVVATGWYDTPVWPSTPGLADLAALGIANHAKTYRGPKGFEGKRCLVIGNANSANDIAAQLRAVGALPIYQSIRRPAFPGFPYVPDEHITMVAPVASYSLTPTSTYASTPAGQATAHLTDGTTLPDLDAIFVATGYVPNPHFIHVLDSTTGALRPLMEAVQGPARIPGLHNHIMYAHNPTLGFIGAPMSYTPFTLADASSTWLALAWAGALAYPRSVEGRLAFERERVQEIEKQRAVGGKEGEGGVTAFVSYMVLAATEQEYARGLVRDVEEACPALVGVLPEWSEERTRKREAMWPVKLEALRWARGGGSYGNVDVGLN